MTFRKNLKYFQEKIKIDKAVNKRTAYKIQVFNNNKIDEYIKSYNEEGITEKPTQTMLSVELSALNKPEVYKNYNRIINSKYTSDDVLEKILIKNKANKDLNRIVEAEVERIAKNLDYVEQVMKKYEIPQKMYEEFKAKQKQNSLANRQEILNQVAIKANDLLVSEGINIPSNVYSYKNLEGTAENLLRQSQMQSKHEQILAINKNYQNEGKDKIYKGKQWIWTGKGKTTRHASNHLQKRNLNEPFIIVNDKTLHIDELMYPSDPAGSIGNTFICYCEIEYLTEGQDTWDITNSPILNTSKNSSTTSKSSTNVTFGNASSILENLNSQPKKDIVEKPMFEKKYIDTKLLGEIDDDIIDIPFSKNMDGDLYDFNFNEKTGKWNVNGLDVDKNLEYGSEGGYLSLESIAKHNSNLPKPTTNKEDITKTVEIPSKKQSENKELPIKQPINLASPIVTPTGRNGFVIYKKNAGNNLKFNKKTGMWEYKGMEVLYNKKFGEITFRKRDVEKHNTELGEGLVSVQSIDTNKLKYDPYTNRYEVNMKDVGFFEDKYYYNGVELEKEGIHYYISKEKVDAHNKTFGIEPNPSHKPEKAPNNAIEEKIKKELPSEPTVEIPVDNITIDKVNDFTFEELADYHDIKYTGLKTNNVDNKQYHVFTKDFGDGNKFNLYFENGAVNSYKKGGIATPNEIIHEVMKVPQKYLEETNEIWFKNTLKGIRENSKGDYDTLRKNLGGYNVEYRDTASNRKLYDNPNHRIVINPKYFKNMDVPPMFRKTDVHLDWKHAIWHELTHSLDLNSKVWKEGSKRLAKQQEFKSIHNEEKYFTARANVQIEEEFAEHGSYIAYMETNPSEQGKLIEIMGGSGVSDRMKINYEEYKELYPKHYKYFKQLIFGA